MFRHAFKSWLLSRGVVITKPPGQFSLVGHKLRAAKGRGLTVTSVVDGGAADGAWAREINSIYPEARILCVEPRESACERLRGMSREVGDGNRIDVACTLLSEGDGAVTFNEMGDQSSMFPNSRGEAFGTARTVPAETLDHLIERLGQPSPDFIKLDLQGAELSALRGAPRALEKAQALLLELSFIPLQRGTPLADEVIRFVGERGFRIYDILGLWHRPLDGALAQGDFLFVRDGHPLLRDGRWSADAQFA